MTDNRAGQTRLLVTTLLAAFAVGAVLVVDAYMQEDLQEPVASLEAAEPPRQEPQGEEAWFDPGAACWGPFLPQVCTPPLVPSPNEAEKTALNEPIADTPAPDEPEIEELPAIDMNEPEEVALSDRAFASVIDSWHAPRHCATSIGIYSGTPTVRMEMDIDGDGRVKNARALDVDDTTEQQLATCLESRARGLRFPKEEVRRETTRDATFVF
jgi:hypothetical protein